MPRKKKDEAITTGNLYGAIEKAVKEDPEKLPRKREDKGHYAIYAYLTPAQNDFVRLMASYKGISMTQYVAGLIEKQRQDPEESKIYETLKNIGFKGKA